MFLSLLESEYSALEVKPLEETSTKNLNILLSHGWDIALVEEGITLVKKNDTFLFVEGESIFHLDEQDQRIDFSHVVEQLEENPEVLEENFKAAVANMFKRNKPKIRVYTDGSNIISTVKRVDGTMSMVHIVGRKVYKEKDNISPEEIKNYLKEYSSCKKIVDKHKLIRIASLGFVLGIGITSGVSTAFLAIRGLFFLVGLTIELLRPIKYNIHDEDTRQTLIASLEKAIQSNSEGFTVDVNQPLDAAAKFKVSDIVGEPTLSDTITTLGAGGSAAASVATV